MGILDHSPGAVTLRSPCQYQRQWRELKVAPGDTLGHGGQPPLSGTRVPGVDPGLPYRTARLWARGITTHAVSVSSSVRVKEVICKVSSGTRPRARAWEGLAVPWGRSHAGLFEKQHR